MAFAQAEDADYFVSLHCNAGGGNGYEVFYPLGEVYSEASRQFAHRLGAFYGRYTKLRPRSPHDGAKSERQASVRRLGVLHGHNQNTMAVLLEMLFIDNPEEVRLAASEAFIRQVWRAFEEAIVRGR